VLNYRMLFLNIVMSVLSLSQIGHVHCVRFMLLVF